MPTPDSYLFPSMLAPMPCLNPVYTLPALAPERRIPHP